MGTQRLRLMGLGAALAVLCVCASLGQVKAAAPDNSSSSSSSYSIDQAQFGAGSQQNACSATYCSDQSAGDTAVGSASSDHYTAQFGSDTDDKPLLEVIAAGGIQDLGVLDTSSTASAVATVKVRSYLSDGYIIVISGLPPTQGTHTLHTDTSPTSSHAGAEQFGINLASNDTPSVGADPVQVPSGAFSHGAVADDYSNPNLFMYHDGDTIAQSPTSSGETDYTISMILNVSNVTPGGRYTSTFQAVVVPLY